MAVHYRTEGIFIKKSARGEADEVFTVYTKSFGKLRILGKAIRKISSKLRGGSGLFYFSDIEFIQGKTHKTLTDAVLIDKFSDIRKDLLKLRIVHKIAEILDELVHKEEKDEQLWELLSDVFQKLNDPQFKIGNPQLAYYYFFWNLVAVLGYKPDITGCLLQGKKIDCDAIKILKLILKKDWSILSRLKIEAKHIKLLRSASEWYNETINEK